MLDRLRYGVAAAVIAVVALVVCAIVFGHHAGHKNADASAATPSATATKPAVSHAPNAPSARPGTTAAHSAPSSPPARTVTHGPKAGPTSAPAVKADPYRLGALPRCDTSVPKVGAIKVPSSWNKKDITDPSGLARSVVTLLQAVYTENYNDTHQCRVTRVENTHLVRGNWVYSGMDLSVSTSTTYDVSRIQNKVDITGTVLTDQLSRHVVTPTDVYVFAPVQIGADGYGSSLFKTGTTWIYKGGTWRVNSFGQGSDS